MTVNLARLRRAKCFEHVRGGCTSLEITNEGAGWHLHAHSLLDVRWLDMETVSRKWGKLVGQNFAIVKIKDVRKEDYMREICKYVVEGSEIARWPAEQILEFVTALKGLRCFTSFGALRELAPAIREELHFAKPLAEPCECGSRKYHYRSETDTILAEAINGRRTKTVWKK